MLGFIRYAAQRQAEIQGRPVARAIVDELSHGGKTSRVPSAPRREVVGRRAADERRLHVRARARDESGVASAVRFRLRRVASMTAPDKWTLVYHL